MGPSSPSPPPPPNRRPAAPRGQEPSIKDRKTLLFELDGATRSEEVRTPTRPFAEYLRTTPAAPLSKADKVLLWTAGVVVLLLALATLLKH